MPKYEDQFRITQEEISAIKNNSPESLPLNPTGQGYSGAEVRRKLTESVTGENGSVLALMRERFVAFGKAIDDIELSMEELDVPEIRRRIKDLEENMEKAQTDIVKLNEKLGLIDTKVDKKLDKVWTDIVEQSKLNLTDYLVLNRNNTAHKVKFSNLLASIPPIKLFLVVEQLPEIGIEDRIYLVPSKTAEGGNRLTEYIWVNNGWELIGELKIDLKDYAKLTDLAELKDEIYEAFNTFTDAQKLEFQSFKTTINNKIESFESRVNSELLKISGTRLTINQITNGIYDRILVDRQDLTLLPEFKELNMSIPMGVTHGFYTGLNCKTNDLVESITLIKTSPTMKIKYFENGYEVSQIYPVKNSFYSFAMYFDGLCFYCYYYVNGR